MKPKSNNPEVDWLSLVYEGDTRNQIPYRPAWNKFTGSPMASIFLGAVIREWIENDREPFVKFNAPCGNSLYETGKSWQEELGLTRRQFEGARDEIAYRLHPKQEVPHDVLIFYWVDKEHIPHYVLNETVLGQKLAEIYPQKANVQNVHQLMYKTCISPNVQNVHQQQNGRPNVQNVHQPSTSGKNGARLPNVQNVHRIKELVVDDLILDKEEKTTTTSDPLPTLSREQLEQVQTCLDAMGFTGNAKNQGLTVGEALAWYWWVCRKRRDLQRSGRKGDPVAIAAGKWRTDKAKPPKELLDLALAWLQMGEGDRRLLLRTAERYTGGGMYLPEELSIFSLNPVTVTEVYSATNGTFAPDAFLPGVEDEPEAEEPETAVFTPITTMSPPQTAAVPSRAATVPRASPVGPGGLTAQKAYEYALTILKGEMALATYNAWLKDAQLLNVFTREGSAEFHLGVRNDYAKDWVVNRLLAVVSRTIQDCWGGPVQVQVEVAVCRN